VTRREKALAVFLLAVAATSRMLLQVLAMPPYAGLDEPFHVARLVFVRSQDRNPTRIEPSVPEYIIESTECLPGVPPAFSQAGQRWPELATSAPWADPPLPPTHRFLIPNYQAQHPSLYYTLLAPLPRLAGTTTRLTELTALRLGSVVLALVAIAGVACIAFLAGGRRGLVAAALLAVAPNWLILVGRLSNDALACGLLAAAIALSLRRRTGLPGALAEAAAWAGAVATKLYAWPAVVLLPILWRKSERRDRRRILLVVMALALSLGLTCLDLKTRTGHLLGSQAFDRLAASPVRLAGLASIEWARWLRVLAASAVWMPGQHGDALRPAGMVLYSAPVVAFAAIAFLRRPPTRRERKLLLLAAVGLGAFGLAQAVNAAGFIRRALTEGTPMPSGGGEGWYLWSQAPFIFGVLLAVLLVRKRARRAEVGVLLLWLVAWDVLLHEGGLFRDWAGQTSPLTPGFLFRWGPPGLLFGETAGRLAATSASRASATTLLLLRGAHVVATVALAALVLRTRPSPAGRTAIPL
jgi:hypothetical protein